MPVIALRRLCPGFAALGAVLLAGCGSFDAMSHRVAGVVSPYRVEVVQGNFISREQVEALKPGMSRQQVREILGTPLVTSLFHADRWDYVFTMRRDGVAPQQRRLSVHFQGEAFQRAEGDTLPTESEFVATLDNRRKSAGKAPPMEATEEQLKAYARKPAESAAPTPAPAARTSYPPLEAPAR